MVWFMVSPMGRGTEPARSAGCRATARRRSDRKPCAELGVRRARGDALRPAERTTLVLLVPGSHSCSRLRRTGERLGDDGVTPARTRRSRWHLKRGCGAVVAASGPHGAHACTTPRDRVCMRSSSPPGRRGRWIRAVRGRNRGCDLASTQSAVASGELIEAAPHPLGVALGRAAYGRRRRLPRWSCRSCRIDGRTGAA